MTRARILADYVSGGTTAAEFDYLDGVTSNVQTQMDLKAPLASPAITGTPSVTLGSDATGDVYYRAAGGALTRLATGAYGTVLTSTGAAAVPAFEAVPAGGITEADHWKLSTTTSGTFTPLALNLIRSNSRGFGLLGTGMTCATTGDPPVTTGIFSFPSTGYWKVGYTMGFQYNGDSKYNGGDIQVTINSGSGDTYAAAASNWAFIQQTSSGTTYAATYMETIVDVTSVSTVKVRFTTSVQNSSAETLGNSSYTITGMQFIRLGDT